MERKIKICWYCEKWQPGGIQNLQVNLLQHMHMKKMDFHIIVSEDDTKLFDEKLDQLGVKKSVSLKHIYKSPGKRVLANIFSMRKILKKGQYDVVHFNACHGVELIYVFWTWLYRVPIRIVHCRNNDIGSGGKSRQLKILCHKIGKGLFKNCANIKLANSDLAAIWLFGKRQLENGKVQILKNGIDLRKYNFNEENRNIMRARYNITDKLVVGHIGHFNYQKNHEFLLNIFEEILKRQKSALLLLVGTGEREQEIRQLAKKMDIDKNIIFYGVTEEVSKVLDMMDVFVFPSRFEGFGNVLVEAQASGLTCFASEGVIPKAVQVTPNVKWLSLNDSAEIWANAILKAGKNRDRRSYVQSIRDAGYDISDMAVKLEKIYFGKTKL